MVGVDRDPVPGTVGMSKHTFTPRSNLPWPPTDIFLGVGIKPENVEETHMDTGRTRNPRSASNRGT